MMNSDDGKMNNHLQRITLIQSLNVSKLDDTHISFIEDLILKDLNTACIQNIYHMILPLALSWAEYDSPVKLKLLSCKILGESISNIDDSLILQRHVLPITQYLLQDTEPQVRSSVCKQLPSLLCKVDQLSENLLLTSLLDAAQDSSANVRCAVLDVLIESEPYIYKGYIKDLILPTLKKLVESCFVPDQDEFLLHVCKLYSRLCNTYKEYMQLEDQAWFVSQFASLCQVDNEPMTSFLCSNLVPMMLFVESAPGLCQVLVSCVLALSTSPYVSVRQILSSTLFEIVKTCDVKSRRLLLEVLMVLLREKLDVFHSLIPHLYSLISNVLNSTDTTENYPSFDEKLISSLRHCEETVSKCYKWRLHVLLMQEIQKLVDFLSATTFMEHFQEILFHRIKKSRPIPSRLAASKTLLVLLTKLDNESLTSKCISRIHKDLYCSRSFYDRNLFVKICHQTIQMLAFDEFKKYFLPSLILLSADPVPNIRYSVTGLLVHSSVRLMCCPAEQAIPTELTTRIEQCLAELKNDPDVDVSANVNSLVSKVKEKRASALLNLLIEPALVVQEDLEDQIPPNTTTPIQEGVPSRSVIIHPYMKASIEKEFLIDTGIPFNSTPMSENYNKIDMNKSLDNNVKKHPKSNSVTDRSPDSPTSPNINNTVGLNSPTSTNINKTVGPNSPNTTNINKTVGLNSPTSHNINNTVGLNKSYQDTSGISSKETTSSKDIILNDNIHYDNNGNLALHDIQRKTSKLGTPKKFGFNEKISGSEKVSTNVVDSGLSTDEMCLPPPPPPYNDNETVHNETSCTVKHKEQISYDNETSCTMKHKEQISYQTAASKQSGNDTNHFESIPKNNINEHYVHGKTYQSSTNQNETSSNIMMRYQMVKPKNIVRSEPNQPGTNLGINSPGSKLKRAFMSSVNSKQTIIEPRVDGNLTKDISYNQSEPKEEVEQRMNDVERKPTPELKPRDSKKPSLLTPTSYNRVLLSPKDQKRKSVHIMESYQTVSKKLSEDSNISPIDENNTTTDTVSIPSTQHKDNMNKEPAKQSIEMSFQNKRKSMYQPSDRDSLLTSFFKGQTLKYQPKDMIQRKDAAISYQKKEPNLETPPSPEKPPLSQAPISNTLPRIHKFSYQNQLPGPNFRKCKIPEGQVSKKESTKSPETITNDVQIVPSSNSNPSMNNLNEDCNRNITPTTFLKSCEESKIKEKINSDPILLNTEVDEKYPPSTTRQYKINHLDLQNNEFIFYKNKNCSDVEVGHVDSPRNSVVSEQETSTPLLYDTRNNTSCLNIHKQMNEPSKDNIQQENIKPCAENDITQKILNLTNEVETIDQYLNLEATNTTNLPQNITISPIKVNIMQSPCTQSISPLKIDMINSPNNIKGDPVNPNKNLNAGIPPSGMKRSPNLEKKKVMFLNEKIVTPDECQRLSLSFEKELMELNSKIEEINEEIRVETLNLQQAKIEKTKNNVNQNSSHIFQPNSPQGHLPKLNANSEIVSSVEPVLQEQDAVTLDTRNMLQHTPPPTRRFIEHKNTKAIAEEPLDESKNTNTLNTTAAFMNTNPTHRIPERTQCEIDNEPPTLYPRVIPETKTYTNPNYPQQPMLHPKPNISPEPKMNATPEYPNDNLGLDTEDGTLHDEQDTMDASRVFRESKLLKRHAYRRSYDERMSKIDFQGFTKKSDVNNGTSFNKHSTYRRSFDDRNYPNASETVGPNLPPKVPVMSATPTPISSEQKKMSNYQVFSDRRKNILENKSFTVRIGSRSTQQNGKKTPRDISPSLSNSSKNSNGQIVPQVKHKGDNETNNTSQSRSITPEQKREFRSVNTEVIIKDQHLGKTSSLIGKPRVSVSPLKYSTASAIKSIPVGSLKPVDPSIPQIPEDQVTLRKRSISPQTTQTEDNSENGSKLPERNQHVEVPWRRPMSRMQAPRSISQLIESQIPGLNDENTAPPPPPPPREKSIPDISRNIPNVSQIKPRLISKSPSPSKMIQPRYEPTTEINQHKKPIPPPTRQYKAVENVKPPDDRPIKPVALAETVPADLKSKVSGENITKIIKVGPSTAFGYNRNENGTSDANDKSGDTKLTTVVTVKRTSSSGSNESLLRYKKSQGNLSNDSLTNRSEANSEASDSSKIPGKKNFKPSKFSCLRSDQDSFYKNNCHMGTEERPRSCIIPNGSHPGKTNDNLKSISEENLQQNNRRASSAGAIPQPSGGGSKLPRRSIKF